MTVTDIDPDLARPEVEVAPRNSVRRVLVFVNVLALVAVLVAAGYFWGNRSQSAPYVPNASSVDAGFARDMATHHQQAIDMASYTRDHTTDPAVGILAYDIESSQTIQLGQMTGWLVAWNVARTSGTPMNWMPAEHQHVVDGLMPGMATPDQLTRLYTLTGKQLDIFFLQLMIRHHQGGLPMEQDAATHARFGYVRNLAGSMLSNQGLEIVQMERKLRQLGASPLPPPDA